MNDSVTEEHLLLLGHPPASDFFRLMRTQVPGGDQLDTAELVREWRAACDVVRSRAREDAGFAEAIALSPLPLDAAEYVPDPAAARTERIFPRRWTLIELDRLVVFQKRINLAWTSRIEEALGASPTQRHIMRIAAGQGLPTPPVRVVRSDDSTFTLSCSSGELHFFGMRSMNPRDVTEPLAGQLTNVFGLFVGFGVNAITGLRYRNRVFLTNGSHRAYALRNKGITHTPCWIVEAMHEDDLELIGLRAVRGQLERCARAARPPLFKDYFDAQLRKIVRVQPTDHALQLQVSLTTRQIPAAR
jgi:hypothetical protein